MKRLGTQQPPTFEELIVERKDGTVLSPCYYVPSRSAWRFEGVDIPEDPYDIWQTCEAYKRRSSVRIPRISAILPSISKDADLQKAMQEWETKTRGRFIVGGPDAKFIENKKPLR